MVDEHKSQPVLSAARPCIKSNSIGAAEGTAGCPGLSLLSQHRNVGADSQLFLFPPISWLFKRGLGSLRVFANCSFGFNDSFNSPKQACWLQPYLGPSFSTLAIHPVNNRPPVPERRASTPFLLNVHLSSSKAGGLLMATKQVTPKECLFAQIDNAWLHVCK